MIEAFLNSFTFFRTFTYIFSFSIDEILFLGRTIILQYFVFQRPFLKYGKFELHFSSIIYISGIKTNLHIVLLMDYTNPNFSLNCESNPAFYKECSVQWMEGWSKKTMNKVDCLIIFIFNPYLFSNYIMSKLTYLQLPAMMLSIESSFLTNDMYSSFYDIHSVVTKKDPRISSPRHIIKLINSFRTIFIKKRTKVIDRQKHLKVK